ncbi:MAG: hypothetical protein ABI233_04440 [Chthoniobacterales bacterium]
MQLILAAGLVGSLTLSASAQQPGTNASAVSAPTPAAAPNVTHDGSRKIIRLHPRYRKNAAQRRAHRAERARLKASNAHDRRPGASQEMSRATGSPTPQATP